MTNYYSGSKKSRLKKYLYKQLKLTLTVLCLFIMLQINAQNRKNTGSTESASAGGSSYSNLAVDGAGHYYLAYDDASVSKGSVQNFNGITWAYRDGAAAFTEGTAKVKRIALTPETPVTVCSGTDPGLNTGDTGCISFTYAGETVAYTTVRAADGKIWLQQNLGSDNVAGAAADETGYGDIFQWGRWADGHQKRTSVANSTLQAPNNPTGLNGGIAAFITSSPAWWAGNALTDTWAAENPAAANDTNGCDPCKALGEGWQLPAQADWTALINAENISNPATAFSSSLKLPATGYRSASSGSFTFVGTRGYYWSSDVANTGGKYLYIGTASANPSSGAPRGQGAAVRCIKMVQQNQVGGVVVTTSNNIAAAINTADGTLQLSATITPVTANQNVTWSIASGTAFATVDANGLVTAITNGSVVVRATSVADATKFGELNVVVDIPPVNNCPSLTSLYENFDTLSCCAQGVVPPCWDSILLGGASQIISGTQPASGTSQIYQNGYGAGKISIVVLPQLSNINAGTHQFRFKVKANSTGLLDFGYISDVTDAATFVVIESPTITNSSYNSTDAERIFTVPVTVPANARLALRNPGTSFAGIYWDDVYWEPIPVSVLVTTLNNVPASITTGNGTLQLVATVNPAAVSQNVTWSVISGSEFATVDSNGLVTAIANGTVVIRATSTTDTTRFDDIEITVNYTVVIPVDSVAVTVQDNAPAEITTANGTLQLIATVNPAGAIQTVAWSVISGSEFATVDSNGLVTAIANGTVVIRAASTTDTTRFDDIEIMINISLGTGNINKNSFTIYPNPTNGSVTIQSDKEVLRVKIYNQLGQLILAEGTASPQLSGMQEGIYIMEVEFKDGTKATCKIMKN